MSDIDAAPMVVTTGPPTSAPRAADDWRCYLRASRSCRWPCSACRKRGRVYTREALVRQVWGLQQAQARTVDNFVAQLRAKLEEDPEQPRYLLTVRGSGYRFAPE